MRLCAAAPAVVALSPALAAAKARGSDWEIGIRIKNGQASDRLISQTAFKLKHAPETTHKLLPVATLIARK